MSHLRIESICMLAMAAACSADAGATGGGFGEGTGPADVTTDAATGNVDSTAGGGPSDPGDPTEGAKFDLAGGFADLGTSPPPSCKVVDDMDAIGECEDKAPPDSFEPDIQWTWTDAVEHSSLVTPLVGNLTDDNGDGAIDLCDVPDIVVVATSDPALVSGWAHIWLLDGATGTPHMTFPDAVNNSVTPAIGDIDGDGVMEIVTAEAGGAAIVAFEHDGTPAWRSTVWWPKSFSSAITLADLEGDGDVEILAGRSVFDHQGNLVFAGTVEEPDWAATAAADIDDDGDLEIVLGTAAYQHDGTLIWSTPSVASGFPQVANFDDDADPEILVTNVNGLALLERDGTVVYQDLRPTGVGNIVSTAWHRPAAVHDFDGDGKVEYAMSSQAFYSVYRPDASIVWSAGVLDFSGVAGGTAFDFLGDGTAEAMYADESTLFVFDGAGVPLLEIPRTSRTLIEYPVVADVDNDGSAEIVVVSNIIEGHPVSPSVQVIRDVDDRWIQARRIWNQHAYHVTNVREDGTIPQHEPPSHATLNTYRTNAQIENGGLCHPRPAG